MRIKSVIILTVICFSALSLCAQKTNNRYHSYGSSGSRQFKGFAGPLVTISDVEGNLAVDMGGSAGVILYKNIFIGLYGQTLLTKPPRADLAIIGFPTFTGGEIKMIQAGALLGYMYKPKNMIHWGVSSSAGLGVISLFAKDPSKQDKEMIYDDRIYIVVPKLFAELNMTDWLKVNVSAGYRVIGKVNGTYINQDNEVIPTFYKSGYTKPEFSVSLLFGTFGSITGLLD